MRADQSLLFAGKRDEHQRRIELEAALRQHARRLHRQGRAAAVVVRAGRREDRRRPSRSLRWPRPRGAAPAAAGAAAVAVAVVPAARLRRAGPDVPRCRSGRSRRCGEPCVRAAPRRRCGPGRPARSARPGRESRSRRSSPAVAGWPRGTRRGSIAPRHRDHEPGRSGSTACGGCRRTPDLSTVAARRSAEIWASTCSMRGSASWANAGAARASARSAGTNAERRTLNAEAGRMAARKLMRVSLSGGSSVGPLVRAVQPQPWRSAELAAGAPGWTVMPRFSGRGRAGGSRPNRCAERRRAGRCRSRPTRRASRRNRAARGQRCRV